MNIDYLISLDFSAVWTYRAALARGLATSLGILALTAATGFVLGCLLALIAQSRNRTLTFFYRAYIEIWRDTPLIVQLFWIHFALPLFTGISTSALVSAMIGIVGNATAYFAEIVRAGIQAVDQGQWEAGSALGLSKSAIRRKVILPQALRVVVPPLTSLIISLFKATAILSVLSINDLMRITISIANYTFRPVELITAIAVIYFLIGLSISRLGLYIEGRLTPSGRAAKQPGAT